MAMQHAESELGRLGDKDLAKIVSGAHEAFKKRHPGLKDISFPSTAIPDETSVQRNPEEDMLAVFGYSKDQIARSPDQINDNTRAYVGSLVHYDGDGKIIPIFRKIGHLEHIYTSFPEGKIRRETVSIGGKTSEELQRELRKRKINVSQYAEDMMNSRDFVTLRKPENITTFLLKVQDLELEGVQTTDEVYARGEALGLDKCPAETGPHKRLKDTEQLLGDFYFIAMKQIADRHGYPDIFRLARHESGLWLDGAWTRPTNEWNPGHEVVFSLSKAT